MQKLIRLRYGLADVPNREGFRFRGWMNDGELIACIVKKDLNGMHYVADEATGERCYDLLRGWVAYDDHT